MNQNSKVEIQAEDPKPTVISLYGAAKEAFYSKEPDIMLVGGTGSGKAQPLCSLVYTPTGPIPMGRVKVGTVVCNPDGGSTSVTEIHPQGSIPIYRITFACGQTVECSKQHLWTVGYIKKFHKKDGVYPPNEEAYKTIDTEELINSYLIKNNTRSKYWVEPSTIDFDNQKVEIHPYVMGILLGDGCLRNGSVKFSTDDQEVVDKVSDNLPRTYKVNHSSGTIEYRIVPSSGLTGYRHLLEPYGVYGKYAHEKHIPNEYKYTDRQSRIELVQGLMDTDGTVGRTSGMPSYCSTSLKLIEDLKEVIESLGGAMTICEKKTACKLAYIGHIRYNNPEELFALPRKKNLCKARTKYRVKNWIRKIEYIGDMEAQCITVDSDNHQYATNCCIRTHNSVAALLKIVVYCKTFPNVRACIVRKYRSDLAGSALNILEDLILPRTDEALKTSQSKTRRTDYKFNNGSEIQLRGAKMNPGGEKSASYDLIYVMEAQYLEESDWINLNTRLRGNAIPYNDNGKIRKNKSFRQIIGDCNTDKSNEFHWIKQRIDKGLTKEYFIDHKCNPAMYDQEKREWTEDGQDLINRLKREGEISVRRNLYGEWCSEEGRRFPQAHKDVQGFEPFKIPHTWPRFISLDWGYKDPFCCLWHAVDPSNGNVYTYREMYRTGVPTDEQARMVIKNTDISERIQKIYVDPTTQFKNTDAFGLKQRSYFDIWKNVFVTDSRFGHMIAPPSMVGRKMNALSKIDSYLTRGNDHPDWFISSDCKSLWKELIEFMYKGVGEKVVDKNDHAITSAYYFLFNYNFKAAKEEPEIDYARSLDLLLVDTYNKSVENHKKAASSMFKGVRYGQRKFRF